VWFFLIAGYSAFRAPGPLTVAMAYIQVACRFVQVIGVALKKRRVAQIGYIAATLFMYIMFIGAMADKQYLISFF
jgi:hypothetical protein